MEKQQKSSATLIKELENLKASRPTNLKGRAEKKKQKEVLELELKEVLKKEKIEQGLIDFVPGVYVCKVNNPLVAGVVVGRRETSGFIEVSVKWEPSVQDQLVPKSAETCEQSVLKILDSDLFKYRFQGGKLTRDFDGAECDNLAELATFLEETKDEEVQEYIISRYSEIGVKVLEKRTHVKIHEEYYSIEKVTPGENGLLRVTGQHITDASQQKTYSVHKVAALTTLEEIKVEMSSPPTKKKEVSSYVSTSSPIANKKVFKNVTSIEKIDISHLKLDSRLQQRVKYDKNAVTEYSKITEDLPPVKVVRDDQGINWVWDGYHTVRAHGLNGEKEVRCEVQDGNFEKALMLSFTANTKRGVRLSSADRKKAIVNALNAREEGLLTDEKGKKPSNRWLAKHLDVSYQTVNNVVNEIKEQQESSESQKNPTDFKSDPNINRESSQDSTDSDLENNLDSGQASDSDPWAVEESKLAESPSMTRIDEPDETFSETKSIDAVFERPSIPLSEDDLVRIKSNAQSKAVLGLQGKYCLVTDAYENSVDLQTFDKKQIVGIPRYEVNKVEGKVNYLVSLDTKKLIQLMKRFETLEEVIELALVDDK